MRSCGSKNSIIHWQIKTKDDHGKVVSILGFPSAQEAADYLKVKKWFLYDYTRPNKKKYIDKEPTTFTRKNGTTVKRKGKYEKFFKKYEIIKL